MKVSNEPDPGGFVLLEVLPAILVFSVLLLLGFRIFWSGLRLNHESKREAKEDAALLQVWNTWKSTGGTAALAVRSGDGTWQVYDFPDESWLPSAEDRTRWIQGREWRVFRRRRSDPDSGRPGWEVEVKHAGIDQEPIWKWKCRIGDPALPGLTELELLQ